MQKSSFFNSVNGDRRYKAEEWAEYFAAFIGNGIFPNPATNLTVQANANMTITVKTGKAWINGYFFNNTTDTTIQLDTADGALSRIDRVVIKWSLTNRSITILLKKGAVGSFPIPPALQRDADAYELAIADVFVNNGAVQILQTNITDLRLNSELCGYVTQTVQTIDTSQLAAQLEAWFAEYQKLSNEEYKQLLGFFESLKAQGNTEFAALQSWFAAYQMQANADFLKWFNNLKNVLDTNAETHILNLIDAVTIRVDTIEKSIFNNITDNPYIVKFDILTNVDAAGNWNKELQRLEC